MKPFKAKFGQGGFHRELYVSAKADGSADVAATFDMQGVTLEEFGLLLADELQGGALEAWMRLTAEGASPAQLVAALDGEFGVDIGVTTLANDVLDLAGSDLLTDALNRPNPFLKEDRLIRV